MRKVISQQKADKTFKRQKKFNTSLTFKEDKPKNKKDEMIKDIWKNGMDTIQKNECLVLTLIPFSEK